MSPMLNGKRVVRIGSRTSVLALTQTNIIMEMLKEKHCDLSFKLVTMDTIGDLILDKALSKIGDKSLFTKELELALLENVVDFVVHSLKDVPTALDSRFVLACVSGRIVCEDAVVMRKHSVCRKLEDLPAGSVIGTSSVRRVAQLTHKYPELKFESVRGNLNTRLRKLDTEVSGEERYEAIILARAGLERLGWHSRISQILDDEDCLYAVGQGALACECRSDDLLTMKLLSSIHDENSALTSITERALMRHLDGGCSTPIAVKSSISGNVLHLRALVMSVDGSKRVEDELEIVLPEEDLNTVLERTQTNGNCAVNKRVNRKRSRIERLEITSAEVTIAREAGSIFTGVKVFPICDIGRLRMAVSQFLGVQMAQTLLSAGAKVILDNIKRTEGELNNLAKPKEKVLLN